MVCRIESTRAGAQVTLTVSTPPGGLAFADRTVTLVSGAEGDFPVPPAAERARWAGQPHGSLCEAADYETIAGVYRRILANEPGKDEVAMFGRYLAEALLGPNLAPIEAEKGPVDVRLRLNDPGLERLPWEMMHSAAGPLAARPAHRLSITREVATVPGAASAAGQLDLPVPLKVLFVVGATIDPVLRPGAEFLGLLRHLRIPDDPTFTSFRNASVNIHYLGDADIDALKSVCATFRPSVAHFICHGERTPGTVETRVVLRKLVTRGAQRATEPLPLTSKELFEAFTEAGHIPPAVVVNACYGAGAHQTHVDDGYLPFAADLVARGVSVAVGMAGEVDDRACQLFSLRFYQALLALEPMTEATSRARRAVLTGWADYQQSVEWTRPTLFVREGLDPTVKTSKGQPDELIERAPRLRRVSKSPVMLCDRYDVIAAAQQLFDMAEHSGNDRMLVAMGVGTDSKGVGKTRLLEEIAIRAVYDRFVPIVLRAHETEPARSFLDFALAVSDGMDETRTAFELPEVHRTETRRIAVDLLGLAWRDDEFERDFYTLRKKLRAHGGANGGSPAQQVLQAIRRDCGRLTADAAAKTGTAHRALVLIDELDRYTGAITAMLDNIQYAGLGTPAEPIPVVFNYGEGTPEGAEIKQAVQHLPLARRPDVRPFKGETELRLAYRQFILSAGFAPSRLREKKNLVDRLFTDLHEETAGRPIGFASPPVQYLIRYARRFDVVDDANYEDVLRQFGGP